MAQVSLSAVPLTPRHFLAYSNQMDTSEREENKEKERIEEPQGRH